MQIICIFGASTTWGACDLEKAGWANRLTMSLASKSDYDIEIYNLGVSGNTTNDLLERFNAEAKARHPSLIIFSIGDNDSVYIASKKTQDVPIEQFESNLQELVKRAKKFTDKIVFLGGKKVDESQTTPIPWLTDYHYTNENIILYDKKIKEVAEKNNVFYLRMFDLLDIKNDLDDGLHPNAQGHQKMFERVKDFLEKNKLVEK